MIALIPSFDYPTIRQFKKFTKFHILCTFKKPQSLGIFYSLVTQLLGFRRDTDEYKVMGMSSYGKPVINLDWLIKKTNDYHQNAEKLSALTKSIYQEEVNNGKGDLLMSELIKD